MSRGSKTISRKAKAKARSYDFSKGEIGRYRQRLDPSAEVRVNVVTLDDDVHAAFPDSDSVNNALRGLLKIIEIARQRKAG